MPDAVEGNFHVVDQVQYGPKQHDKAYSDEDSALGLRQIGVDKLEYEFGSPCDSAKTVDNLVFHQVVESESTGNGKQNGQDGYDGEQGAISQCGCFVGQTVLCEAGNAEIDGLDDVIERESRFGDFVFRNTPDVVGQELPECGYTFVHNPWIEERKRKSSRSVSRVL